MPRASRRKGDAARRHADTIRFVLFEARPAGLLMHQLIRASGLSDSQLAMDERELRLAALCVLRVEREVVEIEHAARDRAERDRAKIATYASTLLPPALAEVPGLEVACHYTTPPPRSAM
ncbi:MAG: RacP protein [Streptomyces sp.]